MMKTLFLVAGLLALVPTATLACPGCNEKEHVHASAPAPKAQEPLGAGQSRVTIPVAGMHCSHCASRVQAALTKIDGVKSAAADVEQAQAVVTVVKGKVELGKLAAAVDAAGFKAGTPVEN